MDDEGGTPVPPGTFVLRGGNFAGVSHLNNARRVHEAYGVWGVCAAGEPDKTVEEIAAYGQFGSKTMMTGLSDELHEAGFPVIREPGVDWPGVLITFPGEPGQDEWDRLRDVMLRRPELDNPAYKGKRE